MSILKSDSVTSKSDNTDLNLTGHGSGVPNLEAGFKVGGTAGVPVSELRAGTDGELITWDASGDAATVAVGTATHVLTSNGAGAAPTFQAAGGGAWNFIATATADDSAATLGISGIDTTYDTYHLSVTGLKSGASGNTQWRMRVGDSGGIISSGSDYHNHVGKPMSSLTNYDGGIINGGDHWLISDYIHNATESTGGWNFFIGRTGQTISCNGTIALPFNYDSVEGAIGGWFAGLYKPSSSFALTQLQIYMEQAGNIPEGRMTLWGIAHS